MIDRHPVRAARIVPSLLLTALLLAPAGCREREQPDYVVPGPQPVEPAQAGVRFDPATTAPGTRIGELVLDSVDARQTIVDTTHVGVAHFSGTVRLSGRTMAHPEADVQAVCFLADTESAAALPRWVGDERRPWFCFSNQEEARTMLGDPAAERPATIVIDRYTIHRGLGDEVNSARLVRVTDDAPAATGDQH